MNETNTINDIFGNLIINSYIEKQNITEIDKIDIKKFIKSNFDSILLQGALQKLNFISLDKKEFSDFLEDKNILSKFTNHELCLNFIIKFKSILLEEILTVVHNNKEEYYPKFQISVLEYYFQNSIRIKNLKIMDLKSSQILDNDMKRIVDIINFSKITEIFLQNNNISDKGILIFFSNLKSSRLKSIYLNNNQITEKSVSHFNNIIKDQPILFVNLKIISFENNKINDALGKEYSKEIKKLLKLTIYL